MQLLCTRILSPACHCARLSTIRSQTHPTLLTPDETRSRCAFTHTNPTSHILICSRHCLRPLRIRPQHRSKFQTPSLVPAQSNPDLQSDRPVRCEVLFVGRYSFQSSSFRSLILVNSFVLLVISMRLRATACAAMSIS